MKLNSFYILSLGLLGLFSTVDAVAAKPKAVAATTAKGTTKAAAAATTTAASSSKAPAAPVASPTGNINGEGVPNGSPSDTGCIDGCNVYPPPATDGNAANSLEIYYLAWFPSFKAGQSMNMSFWTTYNPSTQAGAIPSTLNIDLYDQFGNVNLGNIAQNVAIKASASNTPFTINSWTIPSSVKANFNVSNQFMIVFTGANSWRRDRLLQIEGITASPGGGLNPAYANAVTGQTSSGGSGGGSSSSSSSNSTSSGGSAKSTAAVVRSDLWIVICAWTFIVAQIIGFMSV